MGPGAVAQTALGVYAQVIASKTDHGAALDGLVGGADWAQTGAEADSEEVIPDAAADPPSKKPRRSGAFRGSG
jgi:hypothetical protein